MAESPLFDLPPLSGVICDRCGRMFEKPGMVERSGRRVRLVAHQKGGPLCVPIPGAVTRDARVRKMLRRGQT